MGFLDSSERERNRRSTLKVFTSFAFASAFVVLLGCGCGKQQDTKEVVGTEAGTNNFVRSEVTVMQYLKDLGIKIGADKERERIVEVKSSGLILQGNAPKQDVLLELNTIEDYGFQYDVKDDCQTIRFKSMWRAAMRTIAVRVSVKTQLQSTMTKSGDGVSVEDKLSKVVRVEPLDTILPVDPSKTKWIELERVDPMTGVPVRCVIPALYSGGGGSVTKSALGQDTKEM